MRCSLRHAACRCLFLLFSCACQPLGELPLGDRTGGARGAGNVPGVAYQPLKSLDIPDTSVTEWELSLKQQPGGPTLNDLENDSGPANVNPVVLSGTLRERGSAELFPVKVHLRGHSTRLSPQKSYRITIDKEATPWRGTREVLLNKHPYDLTRVRNRLTFDLLQTLPELRAPKTRFATLRIDGQARGFFTQVERIDKAWLASRGLDAKGYLYKAEQFEFGLDESVMKTVGQAGYNKAAFEKVLQIDGREDHGRLQAMLRDVNDEGAPINTVMARHFDRANYLTWLAFNILTGNKDTNSQNFYLYAPQSGGAWQFIPWDFDAAWGLYDQPDFVANPANRLARWQEGPANWWGVRLHRRFMSDTRNRQQLLERMAQLGETFFSANRVRPLLDAYTPVLKKAIAEEPDRSGLPGATTNPDVAWAAEVARLAEVPRTHQSRFIESLQRPMPFFLGQPVVTADGASFTWDVSEDWQGDAVTYDFTLARDGSLQQVVASRRGLATTGYQHVGRLTPGRYYWQVMSRDSANPDQHWQSAFDVLKLGDGQEPLSGAAFFDVP